MWGRTHTRLGHPRNPSLRHRLSPGPHLLDTAHRGVSCLVRERWYDPPPLKSAVASAPGPVTLTSAPAAAIPAWLLRRAPRLRLNCPQLPAPTCGTPVACTWPSSSSSVWLTWPQPPGPQHLSQHSCISSSILLRFAARVQLPRRKGPGTHWAPSAALLSATATCSAC
jgi:hypothetical protein